MRFLVFLSVYAVISTYAGCRLVSALALGVHLATLVSVVIFLLAAAMPAAMFLRRRLSRRVATVCYVAGGYYMAWVMWGSPAALGADGVRLGAWALGIRFPPGIGRSAALCILAAIGFLTAYGTLAAAARPRKRHVDIGVPGLPDHLEGTTIAHVSDLHIGYVHRAGRVRKVVDAVNAEQPDIIVLTGDQADGDPAVFIAGAEPLRDLRAPFGVYAVNGNHEHYGDVKRVVAELSRLGVTVLGNEWVEVAPNLVVAGVEDPTGRLTGEGPDLVRALAGIPSDATVILLAHQPQIFDEASERGVELVLSGHTHGGQIWPWGSVAKRSHTYLAGYYGRGESHLYVSNGVGSWGPLLRVGAPPEIIFHRLTRSARRVVSRRWHTRLLGRARERVLSGP